jgi:hypothetical protein
MIPAGQTVNEMIDTPDPVDGNGSGPDTLCWQRVSKLSRKRKSQKGERHAPVPSNA